MIDYDYSDDMPTRSELAEEELHELFEHEMRAVGYDPAELDIDEYENWKDEYLDSKVERDDPYGYRGLRESDFY